MGATPMMAQYLAIKAAHPDALLFYRMGDFYELFFEDAGLAAEALGIALTHRGHHEGAPVPMCGVPAHAAEGHLATLIRRGHRVAVCEQMEDPSEARGRGAKLMRREVVRLVTPGTLTEDALLAAGSHNHLAAWAEIRGEGALAWADISTGMLRAAPCPTAARAHEMARLAPREILVAEGAAAGIEALAAELGAALSPLSPACFESDAARRRLERLFGAATLDAFGAFGRAEISAMGALAAWAEITGAGARPRLSRPVREDPGELMRIDLATRRSLELTRGPEGAREGSLLEAIDRTRTAMGARLLERRLAAPSRALAEIAARQAAVAWLHGRAAAGERLRAALRGVPDIERATARLAMGRGSPRDLGAVRDGLSRGAEAARALQGAPGRLSEAAAAIAGAQGARAPLAPLVEAPPAGIEGCVAEGADPDLDEARGLQREGRARIMALQARYAQATGIASLKLRHNAVLGYFVEVTARHAGRMTAAPLSATFVHRQGTAQAARFTTAEMSELESRILGAAERAAEIERRAFEAMREALVADAPAIARAGEALAEIDVAQGLAALAREEDWCRPEIEEGRAFAVEGGRHPVVERARRAAGEGFVPNDCDLSGEGGDAPAAQTGTEARPERVGAERPLADGAPAPAPAATAGGEAGDAAGARGAPTARGQAALDGGAGGGARAPGGGGARAPEGGAAGDVGEVRGSQDAGRAAGGRGDASAATARDGAAVDGGADGGADGGTAGAPEGGAARGARLWLLTGPNMGGKSTFLRQNALIAVLAQMGAFVPARRARLGLVSQLFSRVGASDDLARGRSTFMVEMVETAAILHQADARALVILDEIGRGTATYDGLAIAWACFEHLHETGCRGLFATHYHEMAALAERLPGALCASLAAREWEGEVVLLHEVRPGAADRSYGLQVARLAGLPETVVARARAVLEALEGAGAGGSARGGAARDGAAGAKAAESGATGSGAEDAARGGAQGGTKAGAEGGGGADGPPAAPAEGGAAARGGPLDALPAPAGGAAAALAGLPLFAPRPASMPPPAPSAIEARLAAIEPDALSPREALDLLYDLRAMLGPAEGRSEATPLPRAARP